MSVLICRKRSFCEEDSLTSLSKRLCRLSTSSLHPLKTLFPIMDSNVLEKVLHECDNDLDAAIKKLHELSLGYGEVNSGSAAAEESNASIEKVVADREADCSSKQNTELGGAEWVELFVREMMSATSIDDAKSRATKVLQSLEQSISTRAATEAATTYQKDNLMQKEQIQKLLRENSILKRAVTMQHERQKENNDKIQEVQHLKQLVSQYQEQMRTLEQLVPQYQEQMRTLEMNNYTLKMHLQQAQIQNTSIPGPFNRDVF